MTRISPRTRIDVAIAVSLFAWAFWWGASRVDPSKGLFYQQHFAPAVMRALGYGFVNPAAHADVPGLADFLSRKRSDLPAAPRAESVRTQPFDYFQPGHRYLLEATALCWRALGVSWSSLWPLYGALFAIMAVGAYGLSRMLLSPVLAATTAVFFCLSGPVNNQLPHLRDFSKAPFILLALALLVHAVLQRGSRTAFLLQSAAIGGVVGIALGFRMDVLAMLPIAAVLMAGFATSARWDSIFISCAALLLLIGTAAILSWPILTAFTSGSNSWHVVILGLMTKFNGRLGVLAADTHEIGWRYYDSYVAEIVNDYARRRLGENPLRNAMSTRAYDSWGFSYYLEVLVLFPADLAVRAIGSLIRAYSTWPRPSMPLLGLVPLLLTTAFLWAARLRWGLIFLLIVAYFGALVSLQYHERHAFYLVLAPIIGTAFLIQLALDQVARRHPLKGFAATLLTRARGEAHAQLIRPGWGRRLVALGCVALVVPALLAAARTHQSSNVHDLLERLEDLPPVGCTFEMSFEDGSVILTPTRKSSDPPLPPVGSRLWLLELALPEGGDVKVASSPVTLLQDCGPGGRTHSRTLVIPAREPVPGRTFLRYTFFTLNSGCPSFRLRLDTRLAPMVGRFCELDSADAGPVLVNALLPEPGVESVPYQRLGMFGSR